MRLAGIGLGIVCKGEGEGGLRHWGEVGAVQVESAGTVVQDYVDGLLRLGGEPGWCFVSKSIGEWLCVKGDLGVGS